MNQAKLLTIIMKMKAGQCVQLTEEQMYSCAEGMLRSAFDLPARRSDVNEFVRITSETWGLHYSENENRTWTIRKLNGSN